MKLPSDTYFNGDFTVAGWVNVQSFSPAAERMLDCAGAGSPNNGDVILAIQGSTNTIPYGQIFMSNVGSGGIAAATSPGLQKWSHLAFLVSGTTGYVYVNATSPRTGTVPVTTSYTRSNCFFGKSNFNGDANAMTYFDDIMFFSQALSQAQLATVMAYTY